MDKAALQDTNNSIDIYIKKCSDLKQISLFDSNYCLSTAILSITRVYRLNVSDTLKNKLHCIYQKDIGSLLFTALILYLYRINNYCNFKIQYIDSNLLKALTLAIELDPNASINQLTCEILHQTKLAKNINFEKKSAFQEKISSLIGFATIPLNFNLPKDVNFAFFICPNSQEIAVCINSDFLENLNNTFFENIPNHINVFLNNLVTHQQKPLYETKIITDEEYQKITIDFNKTDIEYCLDKTIHELFEEQAKITPNNIAVRCDNYTLTYSELNEKANNLAYVLKSLGVKANDIVGLYIERSCEMIISILGILKSGGAYLPLDTSYPMPHLEFMLNDSKTKFLITSANLKNSFKNYQEKTIILDQLLFKNPYNMIDYPHNQTSTNLAYVLYTSGSTGKPKGAAITHKALNNHMQWMKNAFGFSSIDVFLQKTPFSFDASIWEIFMPLLIGAELALAKQDSHKDPILLQNEILKYKASILQVVPTMLNEVLQNLDRKKIRSIKQVFVGGESLTKKIREKFFENFKKIPLCNLYGPTEATIETTFHISQYNTQELQRDIIGKPISNMRIYVLDKFLNPLPIGVTGEIYITGYGLSTGYINQPELTAERFLNNTISPDFCAKMYKTGDIGRWSNDGLLEYSGRVNTEVKIRGKRIDTYFVEECLLKHPYINYCLVTSYNDETGSQSLIAYLILQNKKSLNSKQIHGFLKQQLPDYMIPNIFVSIDKFPLTPSGKIDKRSLPNPFLHRMTTGQEYSPLVTKTEKLIASIWRSLLHIDVIGRFDNFFDLGGHSLTALQFLSKINSRLNINLSVKHIFELPTPLELGVAIDNLIQQKNSPTLLNEKLALPTPLVKLKDKPSRNPIFFIHPVGGTVFWFKNLAKHINDEYPIYGIQDPGIDKKDNCFSSIKELAKFYLSHIKQVQPKGPYLIGGASFGASVAIEIAFLLEKTSEEVAFLPVFDGWAYYPDQLKDPKYFKDIMERQHAKLKAEFEARGVNDASYLFNLQRNRLLSLWNYTPPCITQKITLFKAQELLPEYIEIDAPLNYWDSYISKELIEVYSVPGDHETMFYEPNVKALANSLNRCLELSINDYTCT